MNNTLFGMALTVNGKQRFIDFSVNQILYRDIHGVVDIPALELGKLREIFLQANKDIKAVLESGVSHE